MGIDEPRRELSTGQFSIPPFRFPFYKSSIFYFGAVKQQLTNHNALFLKILYMNSY